MDLERHITKVVAASLASQSNFYPFFKILDLNNKVLLPNKEELEFLKLSSLSNWHLKDFMEHCQLKNRTPLKSDKAISQYKLCRNNIRQCVQDDGAKGYVESLLDKASDKPTEGPSSTTINNFHNVNHGTAIMEAHSAVTVKHNIKKRKIAEDSLTASTEEQSEVLPTTHSDLSSLSEQCGTTMYDWEVTDSEEEVLVEEDVEMNVWDVWKNIPEAMQRDGNIDKYSLEHLDIVQLGNNLGSKITREYYNSRFI
ncbi:hypothetical protein EDC96DRAFT_506427 [Choanephora cucurbitarum]|nr:hypothetical protein EDC96DRAFT_506427 [Choanephora cucurbitarum]